MQAWDWFGDRSLMVVDISLACCAIEMEAATTLHAAHDATSDGTPPHREQVTLQAGDTVAVVVAGTVTDAVMAHVEQIVARHDAKVVSFGVCASSGGPYWDSYAVTKGIGQLLEVDRFVPGCPPTPAALHSTLEKLRA